MDIPFSDDSFPAVQDYLNQVFIYLQELEKALLFSDSNIPRDEIIEICQQATLLVMVMRDLYEGKDNLAKEKFEVALKQLSDLQSRL